MTQKAFSALLPEVSPHVPGCPTPLVTTAIRRAAINVCERSLAWRYAQPKFELLPGVHEYDFQKPDDADVHVVFGTTINDVPIEMLTLEQAFAKYPAWADVYSGQSASLLWSLTPSYPANTQEYNEDTFNPASPFILPQAVLEDASEPRSVSQLTTDKFLVLPLPDNMRTYLVRMIYALKPKRTATSMPQVIMDELEEIIVHGALKDLLIMQNTAWQDRELAQYHARQYVTRSSERRARTNLTSMRGSLVATAPIFA
jgi:hypothetical protein